MRKTYERVVVSYPHNEDFNRHGYLSQMVKPYKGGDIWEVILDETAHQLKKKVTYSELWLYKEEYSNI